MLHDAAEDMLQDEAEAEPKIVRQKRAKARLMKPACQTKTKAKELAVCADSTVD